MDSFSFLDVAILFAKNKKRLIVHFICISIVGVITAFVIPKNYKATALFLPPRHEGGPSNPFNIGLPLNMGGSSDYLTEQIETMLFSNTLLEGIVGDFNLVKVYKTHKRKDSTEMAVKVLKKTAVLKVEVLSGLTQQMIVHFSLSVIDKSPKLAAAIANAMVDSLNAMMNRVSHTQEAYIETFIKSRLDSVTTARDSVSRAMKDFQRKHRIFTQNLSDQVVGSITIFTELKKQLILSEIERDVHLVDKERDNYEVRAVEQRISEIREKMQLLENGQKDEPLPAFGKTIEISHAFLELTRELEILIRLQNLLRQQFEESRIKNARRVPIVRILDRASAPKRKNFPKRSIVVLVIVGVYMIGLITFIFAEIGMTQIDENTREKIGRLKSALSFNPKNSREA